MPLVLHSVGAPLGEPVAEDFDFIRHVWLLGKRSLLDGGGSQAFWRPVAHQLYYLALGPLIVAHPRVVATIHIALLILCAVLLYRTLRAVWSGPMAAAAASFPFLAESTRTLISWPSHFVDLGSLLFAVLALHEAMKRRMATSLVALLAALLCKELAVVAAVLIPLLPRAERESWRERGRWAIATGALTAAWGTTYVAIRHAAHLALPHNLETDAATLAVGPAERMFWAVGNSVRAIFSLPAVRELGELWVYVAIVLLLALAVILPRMRRGTAHAATQAATPAAPSGVALAAPWVAWGLAWFALSSAALSTIFPIWAPNRSLFGGVGFGIALVALLGAARPAIVAALLALRLAALALSPGPPSQVTRTAPATGAFMDFERLARLQRIMSETRATLRARFAPLPHGANVGYDNLPQESEYAFGASNALQVWYGDTTLRWVRHETLAADTTMPLATIVQWQARHDPEVVLVDPPAMRAMLRSIDQFEASAWSAGEASLREAAAAISEPRASLFFGTIHSLRATEYQRRGFVDSALAEAGRALALAPEMRQPRYLIAGLAVMRNDRSTMQAQLDTIRILEPNDPNLPVFLRAISKYRP